MKPRILVVEDHPNSRMALAYQLQLAGYEVAEAADGETALELLETERFALVLTDIVMGEVSGIEVMHTARLQSYHPAVILLTGHASLDTAIVAVNQGAAAYLRKPCSTAELLVSVERAIHHHLAEQNLRNAVAVLVGPGGQPVFSEAVPAAGAVPPPTARKQVQIGDLVVGSSRHYVTFKGQPINVTPIEYALLHYLAQTPGQAQSYNAIVRFTHHIETTTEHEAQALLRPHIRNLRKKLDANVIVTERGIGYALAHPANE